MRGFPHCDLWPNGVQLREIYFSLNDLKVNHRNQIMHIGIQVLPPRELPLDHRIYRFLAREDMSATIGRGAPEPPIDRLWRCAQNVNERGLHDFIPPTKI